MCSRMVCANTKSLFALIGRRRFKGFRGGKGGRERGTGRAESFDAEGVISAREAYKGTSSAESAPKTHIKMGTL